MLVSRQGTAWLVLILTLALLLRLFALDRFPLWVDEWYSWIETRGYAWASIPDDGTFTKRGLESHTGMAGVRYSNFDIDSGNAIAYATALKGWVKAFGASIVSLRGLSAIMGICAVALGWLLCAELRLGRRCQIITGLLMAASPFLLIYSRQARGYMLGVALCLAATVLLFRLLRSDSDRKWLMAVTYGLLVALAGLTHYSTVPIFLGHGLIFLIWPKHGKSWPAMAVAIAICALLITIWMFNGGLAGLERMNITSQNYIEKLSLPPSERFFEASTTESIGRYAIGQVVCIVGYPGQYADLQIRQLMPLLAVPLALWLLAWRKEQSADRRRVVLALLLLAISAPIYAIAMAFQAGHTTPLLTRYAVFSAPYACVLIAWATDSLSDRRRLFGLRLHPLAMLHALLMAALIPFLYGDIHHAGSFAIERTAAELNAVVERRPQEKWLLVHVSIGDALRTNLLLRNDWLDIEQRIDTSQPPRIALHVRSAGATKLIRTW